MKYILIIFIAVLNIFDLNSQSCCTSSGCYIRLDDISGFNTDQYLPELQDSACKLTEVLREYKDEFKVFDFGFYVHSENFQDGFPEEFNNAIAEADKLSPFYLLFGKQADHNGYYTKIWVKIKLPAERAFSCMDEAQLEGLHSELEMIANFELDNPIKYARKECDAMHRLKEFIFYETECCEMGSMVGGREQIVYKVSMFDYLTDINTRTGNKDIVYINMFPDLRDLFFKVSVKFKNDPTPFSFLCAPDLMINIKFEYLNHRSDSETKMIHNIKANTLYKFQDLLGDENITYYGTKEFSFLRGGRVTMKVYFEHDPLVKLCEYKFSIKGYNPSLGVVFHTCDVEYPSFWFLKKMVQQESSAGSTSITDPAQHFWITGGIDLWNKWGDHKYCPHHNSSNDGGWGLCQITNPSPEPIMLWNWRANLWAATQLLFQKIKEIRNGILDDYIEDVNIWNNQSGHENNQVVPLPDWVYANETWTFSGSNLFTTPKFVNYFGANASSGKRSYLDAVLIKSNNGLGAEGKHFIYLTYDNNNKPVWTVMKGCTREGKMSYYVKEVCETVLAR